MTPVFALKYPFECKVLGIALTEYFTADAITFRFCFTICLKRTK